MQVSQITVNDVAEYLKYDDPANLTKLETKELTSILNVAKVYVSEYTNIPQTSQEKGVETLDDHEDFWIAIMVLCQDMHDNRSMYVDKNNVNRVVESILDMHRRNLV